MTGFNPTALFREALALVRPRVVPLPVFGLALAGLLLGGCAGSSNVASQNDGQQVQPLDEVAVVSIRAKKTYQNEMGEPSLDDTENLREAVGTIKTVTERQKRRADPNFAAGAEQVREYLFGEFHSKAPFSLLNAETVLQSPGYKALSQRRDNHWRSSLFATPQDYESLSPTRLREASFRTLIKRLPADPDGMLFAETSYAIVQHSVKQKRGKTWSSSIQNGTRSRTTPAEGDTVTVDVKATVQIRVLDRNGNEAMTLTETARSDEGFAFVYGKGWTADQITEAARQANRAAMDNITGRLQKNLPKSILARTSSVLPSSTGNTLK